MSVKAFSNPATNPVAISKLQQSIVKLGFFNGTEIEQFSLPDDTPCGIWDYFKVNLPTTERMKM